MSTSEANDYKVDLNSSTCPNREQRAGGINVYFGKASQIVKDAREGKLRNCERKFQQASGCVLNFYLAVRVTTIAYKLDLAIARDLKGIGIWRLGLENSNYWTTIKSNLNK